jgi:hypothetical protein
VQLLLFIVFTWGLVAGYALLYLRAAPRARAKPPEYIREPPSDLPPAMVGMLFDACATSDKMAATILDLVRRGVIEMSKPGPLTSQDTRPGEDDRWLQLHRDRVAGLRQFEQELVYEVFDHIGGNEHVGTSDRVRTGDLRDWWRRHPTTAAAIEKIWLVRLGQAMTAAGLEDPKAAKMKQWLTGYGVAVMFLIVLMGVFGPWSVLFFTIGMLMVLWTQRLSGVSQKGAELEAQYEAFRHYLVDYGRFQDKPAEAVAIWEEYLPLAVVLSLGDKAESEVRVGPALFDHGAGVAGYPDEAQGVAYMAFRRGHDPSLPEMRVVHSKNTYVIFTGSGQSGVTVGKSTLNVRQRPVSSLLAVSPFLIFPVVWLLVILLVGH